MTTLDEITINGTANVGSGLMNGHGAAMLAATATTERKKPGLNAGISLDEAPLPYWMSEPCPSWCCALPHQDDHPYDARRHASGYGTVWLTLEDTHPIEEGDDPDDWGLSAIDVTMSQHYRDREPHLNFLIACSEEPSLAMSEAADLRATLAALAATAGNVTGETAGGECWPSPCPAWCTAQHSDADAPQHRAHTGGYGWVTLTMEGLDAGSRPARIGAWLRQGCREAEARVVIACRRIRVKLTLAEARELADDLGHFLAEAR